MRGVGPPDERTLPRASDTPTTTPATTRSTPLPWINYLGSEDFFGLISNTAGGYAFYRDARLRRLTRYRYNHAPYDVGGRCLYLRDGAGGEFWSPWWQPPRGPLENDRCRHGLGYTVISPSARSPARPARCPR